MWMPYVLEDVRGTTHKTADGRFGTQLPTGDAAGKGDFLSLLLCDKVLQTSFGLLGTRDPPALTAQADGSTRCATASSF